MKAIGNINIVPQDIGRVILNLINNAFYAVDRKEKARRLKDMNQSLLSVQKKMEDKVVITVKDNGTVFLKKYWIKYFNHFLPPNQPDREQAWVCR